MVYLWSVFAVLILDQVSKGLILQQLELFQAVPIIAGWLNFTLWHNSGGAFGILQGRGSWLAWVAVFVSIAIVILLLRFPRPNRIVNLGLALIAGGALGNLIDRIRLGYVVDFVQVCLDNLCGFPVFNVADSAIVVGTGLIFWAWLQKPTEPEAQFAEE